jgi:hypothetical protein
MFGQSSLQLFREVYALNHLIKAAIADAWIINHGTCSSSVMELSSK